MGGQQFSHVECRLAVIQILDRDGVFEGFGLSVFQIFRRIGGHSLATRACGKAVGIRRDGAEYKIGGSGAIFGLNRFLKARDIRKLVPHDPDAVIILNHKDGDRLARAVSGVNQADGRRAEADLAKIARSVIDGTRSDLKLSLDIIGVVWLFRHINQSVITVEQRSHIRFRAGERCVGDKGGDKVIKTCLRRIGNFNYNRSGTQTDNNAATGRTRREMDVRAADPDGICAGVDGGVKARRDDIHRHHTTMQRIGVGTGIGIITIGLKVLCSRKAGLGLGCLVPDHHIDGRRRFIIGRGSDQHQIELGIRMRPLVEGSVRIDAAQPDREHR